MTNGTQVQADDTVGGPQPPGPQPPGAQPADPLPADPLPAGLPPAGLPPAGLVPVDRAPAPVARPPHRRPPLAVIPRRATGTHTAIPDMDDTPPDAARTEEFGPPVPADAPAGQPGASSRRPLVLSAAAVSLVAVLGMAAMLWPDTDRPAAAPQQVVPIGVQAPPIAAPEPSTVPPAAVTEPDAPEAPPEDVVRPEDWMPDGGLPDAESTTGGPGGAAPTTGPAPAPTATATQPADRATPPPPRREVPPAPQGRANTAGRNLALNRPIFASSFANRLRSPGQAVDGSLLSRWSTRSTDPQWLAVDLGDTWQVSRVRIAWELAYADTYRVDLSTDGRSWTSVWQTRAGLGGTVGIPLGDATARYVRVYGVKPAGPFGFSIRELDVR
jgi:hypothetical protein